MARMYWRKRIKKTGINLSWSKKNGIGASLSMGSKNKKGMGWAWNTKSGFRLSLRGTGLYWTFGKGPQNQSNKSFDKDEKVALKIEKESAKYIGQLEELSVTLKRYIEQYENNLDFDSNYVDKAQKVLDNVLAASKEVRFLYERKYTLEASLSSYISFTQRVFERYLKVVVCSKIDTLFYEYEITLDKNIDNIDILKSFYIKIKNLNFKQFDLYPNMQSGDKKDLEKIFNTLKVETENAYVEAILKKFFEVEVYSINSLFEEAKKASNKSHYLNASFSKIEKLKSLLIGHSRLKAFLVFILEIDEEKYLPKNSQVLVEAFDYLANELIQSFYDEHFEVVFEIIIKALETSNIQNNITSLNLIDNLLFLMSELKLENDVLQEMKINVSLLLKNILQDCRDDLDATACENIQNIFNFNLVSIESIFNTYYENIYCKFNQKGTNINSILCTLDKSTQFEIEYIFLDTLEVLQFILDKCVEYTNSELANFDIEIDSSNTKIYAKLKYEVQEKFCFVDQIINLCVKLGIKINPNFDASSKSYYELKKSKLLNKFEFLEDFYLYNKYESKEVSIDDLKEDIECFNDELLLVDSQFFNHVQRNIQLNFFQKLFMSKAKKQMLLSSNISREIKNFDMKILNQHLQSTFLIYKSYCLLYLNNKELLEINNLLVRYPKLHSIVF